MMEYFSATDHHLGVPDHSISDSIYSILSIMSGWLENVLVLFLEEAGFIDYDPWFPPWNV